MAHLTIKHLEEHLARLAQIENPDAWSQYAYVETGMYKPYMYATVKAAEKRGYKVECKIRGSVYYVYPKREG